MPAPSTASSRAPVRSGLNERQVRWGADQVHALNREDRSTSYTTGTQRQTASRDASDADPEPFAEEQLLSTNILAINAAKGKVGCCYYDTMTNKLHFIEDQRDSSEWDLCTLSMPTSVPWSRDSQPLPVFVSTLVLLLSVLAESDLRFGL